MFSVDWFSNNIPVWKRYLNKYKNNQTNALEIGSYEGKSATWLLDNVLTHPKSSITCIDNFTQKDRATKWNVEKAFLHNTQPYKSKVKLLKGNSSDVLKSNDVLKDTYDIIYIDADHHSRHVLEDAVLAFDLLKPGGIMIFDDYTDNKEHDNKCPKPAIISFLNAYSNEIKVIHSKWQVIISKRIKPLKSGPCYSELYSEPR